MIVEVKKSDVDLISKLELNFHEVISDIIKDFYDNPYTHYLIYKYNDEILGFINYYLIYDRIEIANFNVLKTFQNMGIGTKLLEYLINKYKDIKNITLEVRCDNIKAIKLYQKMGFKIVSKRNGYYNGIDGLLMERSE